MQFLVAAEDRNTLVHEVCITHRIPRAREARGRNRRKNRSKRVKNMAERNVDGKVPKQGLTSAKYLTIMLPEARDSPYHRLD